MLDGEDKMVICGGKMGTACSENCRYAIFEDDYDDSICCELYDFIESKWIKLEDLPYTISGNGSLIRCKQLDNNMVGLYDNKCMKYDFNKSKWYLLPNTNNNYCGPFKLTEKYESNHVLAVIGFEEYVPKIAYQDEMYWINIEIYDHRDNINKWIEVKSIPFDNENLKAII